MQGVVRRQVEADDGRALRLHGGDDVLHDAIDLLVARLGAEQVGNHADAGATKRVASQLVGIAARSAADAVSRDGVSRVEAHHDVEQPSRVLHRAGDGSELVLCDAGRYDAGTADQAPGGAYADEAGGGGRGAGRLTRVTARA